MLNKRIPELSSWMGGESLGSQVPTKKRSQTKMWADTIFYQLHDCVLKGNCDLTSESFKSSVVDQTMLIIYVTIIILK